MRSRAQPDFTWQSLRVRQAGAPAPVVQPTRRPFSKPSPNAAGAASVLKTAEILPFPVRAASVAEVLPPTERRCWERPAPRISESAARLFHLIAYFERCCNERNLDGEAYTAECMLREQAAFIIGWEAA